MSIIDLYGRIVAHFGRSLLQQQVAWRQIAHAMWTGFSGSICHTVSASHPRSAAFPSVEVRCMVFWTSCVDSDGFPIRQKERLVWGSRPFARRV